MPPHAGEPAPDPPPVAPPGPPQEEAEIVRALVADCLARGEREGPRALDAICAEHPHHAARVRRLVTSLRVLGLYAFRRGPG